MRICLNCVHRKYVTVKMVKGKITEIDEWTDNVCTLNPEWVHVSDDHYCSNISLIKEVKEDMESGCGSIYALELNCETSNRLLCSNINTIEKLLSYSREELLIKTAIGVEALREIITTLNMFGLTLKQN